jgi:hypothetical protein
MVAEEDTRVITKNTRTVTSIALAGLGILAVAAGLVGQRPIEAQDGGGNGPLIAPAAIMTASPQIRTAADMRAAAAAPALAASASLRPFLPTVSAAQYAAQKAAAAAAARGRAPAEALAPSAAAPTLQFITFEGLQAGSVGPIFAPSDSHGAVGHIQYVEVVNSAIRVYTKGNPGVSQPTVVMSSTLPAFFGSSETLFDPRVIYDPNWQRWIVLATRHSASVSDPSAFFWLAASQTNDASGPWCISQVGLAGTPGQWLDYPQLGQDQDGIIVTGNLFSGDDAFIAARLFAIAKARKYNCLNFSFAVFGGLLDTLAPPLVRDQNPSAMLLAANGGTVQKYTLTSSSRSPATLTGPVAITGPAAWTVPPNAPQLGTGNVLDTLDGRFVNASTQVGSGIWNTHTVNNGGIAGVRWYRINHVTNAVIQQGTIPGGSNHLFNASIAANDASNAFMTFSMSSAAFRPQVRYSGKLSAEVAIPFGTSLVSSPNVFSSCSASPCRWGDYSAVSIDPSDTTKAWIVNQYVGSATSEFDWRTRIGRIGQ